ncbi:MAG: ATP-grasp domain-containing protein [Candidatus Aenigmarchaeota archaeon]|nr:ATP-grasp domain-containing protein [Candidatus Aenigmarchaeota archaeon]
MRVGIIYDKGGKKCRTEHDVLAIEGIKNDVNSLRKSIRSLGHEPVIIPLELNGSDQKYSIGRFFSRVKNSGVDMVFNVCEDINGNSQNEINIPAILNLLNIPYTGSDIFGLIMTNDKQKTKHILVREGIPTPRYRIYHSSQKISYPLKFPAIVKPNNEDGSFGIDSGAVVNSKEDLEKRVAFVLDKFKQPALVEEYLEGREFHVSLFGNYPEIEILPISEIVFENFPEGKPKITDYNAKWLEDSEEYKNTPVKCPAEIEKNLEEKIKRTAIKCAEIFRFRDYARVDFRLDSNGRPHVLEVNANPDISPKAGFMRSFFATGKTYQDFVRSLVQWAAARKEN